MSTNFDSVQQDVANKVQGQTSGKRDVEISTKERADMLARVEASNKVEENNLPATDLEAQRVRTEGVETTIRGMQATDHTKSMPKHING